MTNNEQYMVFAYCYFYVSGGFHDYKCSFDNLEDAIKYIYDLDKEDYQFSHIAFNNEIVSEYFVVNPLTDRARWVLNKAVTTTRKDNDRDT